MTDIISLLPSEIMINIFKFIIQNKEEILNLRLINKRFFDLCILYIDLEY